MADYTVTLPPNLNPGTVVVAPLPAGEWVAPAGWTIRNGALHGVVGRQAPASVTVSTVPTLTCGLCGLPLAANALTIRRAGLLAPVGADPDSHASCYRAAVTAKVSRPGGPADPGVNRA